MSAFQALDGIQAGREEPASLHCLYPGTLVGEASRDLNGRELTEVAPPWLPLSPLNLPGVARTAHIPC